MSNDRAKPEGNMEMLDPFAEKVVGGVDSGVKAHDEGHSTLDEKMNHAHSKKIPPPINFELVIRRLAEIENELSRRGANELIEEKKTLRDALKNAMTAGGTDIEYDETSNHEATLVPRFKDVWDVDALKKMLPGRKWDRYIFTTEMIAEDKVKEGIKIGDLKRDELEAEGAVVKAPMSLALYVKERKEKVDGNQVP